ncbi:Cubilin-like 11 [Homarus americanus]|uniref:Cubilin-like 11 n=1 Tax=Homarus americanus TaxID=6706 RepID=A0A8J5JFR6_HOMAM|nr:Cubilin-like 11 [Homarus americanus]
MRGQGVVRSPHGRSIKKTKTVFKLPNANFLAVFESNYRRNHRGFDITIRHIPTICHKTIDLTSDGVTSGYITTPNFPRRHPKNTQCEWWIKAPSGKRIQLTFRRIRIKSSPGCSKAYVVVDKSGTAQYQPATSIILCGKVRGADFASTSDTLNVVFDGGKRASKGMKGYYRVIN